MLLRRKQRQPCRASGAATGSMMENLTTTYQPAPAFLYFIALVLCSATAFDSPVQLLPRLHFILFMLHQQIELLSQEQVQRLPNWADIVEWITSIGVMGWGGVRVQEGE